MIKFKVKSEQYKGLDGYSCTIESEFENKEKSKNTKIWVKLITGALIGFVNGFWGGGGGMLCVPLLQNIIKLPEKKAHATTLLIMLPLSISSLVVYMVKGNLPIMDAMKIGIGFVLGGIIGANILKKISNKWLGYVFSAIIIISGVKIML